MSDSLKRREELMEEALKSASKVVWWATFSVICATISVAATVVGMILRAHGK